MKKILIIICMLIILFIFIRNEETLMIPDESIRFRVIAASNKKEDIEIKEYLVKQIINNSEIFNKLSINDSRKSISDNIDNVKKIVRNTFEKLDYKEKFDINYGLNYFPTKEYKGIKYNSGYYESLVITIGEGKGNNYWCVMFPPLCMIDEENLNNAEYKLKIFEIIKKYIIKK